MSFCDDCGSYMKETAEGFLCPKCRKLVRSRAEPRKKNFRKEDSNAIFVIDNKDPYAKVPRLCPNCGNGEASHWFSTVAGEHAGVRQERTVEHFRCTQCSHSWVESS